MNRILILLFLIAVGLTQNCLTRISFCSKCDDQDQTICQGCLPTYDLIDRSCVKCQIALCTSCNSQNRTICDSCIAGLSFIDGKCKMCQLKFCQSCNIFNSTYCNQCYDGFINRDGKCALDIACPPGTIIINDSCKPCARFCSVCNQNDLKKCQTCLEGFVSTPQGTCRFNITCRNGMVYKNDSCQPCVDYCRQCNPNNTQTCDKCYVGFNLVNNTCIKCAVPICQICNSSDSGKCIQCFKGFTLKDGKCILNMTCANGTIFYDGICTCTQGTYLNDNGVCMPCADENCIICNSTQCSVCKFGFFSDGNKCSKCIENCKICSSSSSCRLCVFPYTIIQGKCKSLGDGSSVTIKPGSKDVVRCPTGCLNCTIDERNNIQCFEVADGYSFLDGLINKCSFTCFKCLQTDPNFCTTCFSGFSLVNGQCQRCSRNFTIECLDSDPSFSIRCIPRYTTTSNSTKGQCKPCANKCFKCDINGEGKCDQNQCQSGSYFDQNLQKCSSCLNNCPVCDSNNPSKCTGCGRGRYSQNQKCILCPFGCKECNNAKNCSSCMNGFSLVGFQCLPSLQFPIMSYSEDGKSVVCFSGFIVKDKNCIFDAVCNSTQSCFVCPPSFYLNNSLCLQCNLNRGCAFCLGIQQKNCQKCQNGFFLNEKACFPCKEGCMKCTNDFNCIQADKGYFVSIDQTNNPTGILQKCSSPCATCANNVAECTSCIRGFQIDGSQCFSTKRVKCQFSFKPIGMYNQSDTNEVKLIKVVANNGQIRKDICSALPNSIKQDDDQQCTKTLKIFGYKIGSVTVDQSIDSSSMGSSKQAQSSIQASLISNGIGGSQVLSTTVSSSGFQDNETTEKKQLNLALILGISIPLAMGALILIIICIVKKTQADIEEPVSSHAKDSEGVPAQTGGKMIIVPQNSNTNSNTVDHM